MFIETLQSEHVRAKSVVVGQLRNNLRIKLAANLRMKSAAAKHT